MPLVEQDEIPVKTLIAQGIDAEDVKKLEDGGIYTCNRLINLTNKYLTGVKGVPEAKVDKILEAAEKKMIPILTKTQKKKLKRRMSKMNKEQTSAQTGDESGSSQPLSSNAQILFAQVATFKEIAFEVIKGLKTEQDIQMFETFMQKIKKITDHAFELKRATLADK